MTQKSLLSIALDRKSIVSLHDQLSVRLRQLIQSGSISAGEPLPSSRDLARDLQVSRNTVISAYDRLLGEGYLESQPRSGIFVSPDLAASKHALPRAVAEAAKSRKPQAQEYGVEPAPFRPCQPDVRLFPIEVWSRLRNRVIRRYGARLLHYQSKFALGLPALRRALCQYLTASRGVRCTWEQIAVTSGSQQAIYLLSQLLAKKEDVVLLEDPGYLGARFAFARAGARVQRLAIDDQGVIPPGKIGQVRLIYTTPSRQFPTGACLPVARRLAMLGAARRSRAWLLEDDYDSEFRYTRPPLPSLHSLDSSGRVIYLGSMSKILFPALRIGFAVLPEQLIQPFESLRMIVDDHGPLIDQATLADFISSGGFYTHIRRCRKAYAARLSTFLATAESQCLPLRFPFTDGGMNQMGLFEDRNTDAESISQSLTALGLDVPSLGRYSLRKTTPGLVFGFTAFDHATIERSLAVAARVIRKLESAPTMSDQVPPR